MAKGVLMNSLKQQSAKERYSVKIGAVAVSVALAASMSMPAYALAETASGAGSSSAEMAQGAGSGSGAGGGQQPSDMPGGTSGGQGGQGGQGGGSALGGGGANTQSFDYSGTYSASKVADGTEESIGGETISATDSLTNAVLVQNGGTLNVDGATLSKSGDATDGDSCNFYGVNSIALAVGEGSLLVISASDLSATSEGSNGVFATDSATAYVYDSSIETTSDNSRGLDATYDGTIVADSLDVTTQGNHCAGVATDRGGGNVSVTNSTFETNGSGSPLLYSTGCIEVDAIEGTATGSQIAGMEGLNTIRISNSTLTSTITDKTASDPIADGVIIYQSTSGDAETFDGDRALFQVEDSTLSSSIESGAMFYVTNTDADIVLSGTTLDFDTEAANLLTVAGNDSNSWGTAGENGGDVVLTGIAQTLEGDIDVDAISSLDFYLTEGSSYTGAINAIENESGYTGDGSIDVVIDADSIWTVTGDSTVTSLAVAEGGSVVDTDGNTVTIVAGGETVVDGTGEYTVTVSGDYSTEADISNAGQFTKASIDRTAFDEQYGTETTFGENGVEKETSTTSSDSAEDSADQASNGSGIGAWFSRFAQAILNVFGW